MPNELARTNDERTVGPLSRESLIQSANELYESAQCERTEKAYASDWRQFVAFCQEQQLPSLPASQATLILYMTALSRQSRKPATILRHLAAINCMHDQAQVDRPGSIKNFAVNRVWTGIKRKHGMAQTRKAAATTEILKKLTAAAPSTLTGVRDRALLLIGFAAALRRSELVALKVEDVRFVEFGLELTIRRSKTDQEGAGEVIGIHYGSQPPTCPVRALQTWLQAAHIDSGPLFRGIRRYDVVRPTALNDRAVAEQIKKYARAAGLDPKAFSGHSLRAGLATSAANAGASERRIMDQTRHKSVAMVRRYIREGNLFRDNVSAIVGL